MSKYLLPLTILVALFGAACHPTGIPNHLHDVNGDPTDEVWTPSNDAGCRWDYSVQSQGVRLPTVTVDDTGRATVIIPPDDTAPGTFGFAWDVNPETLVADEWHTVVPHPQTVKVFFNTYEIGAYYVMFTYTPEGFVNKGGHLGDCIVSVKTTD